MSEQDQKLIDDGNATLATRWKPCELCGRIGADYGTAPIVIGQRVYRHKCWFNARNLIPNN
jgi:hypothetical protein